MTLRILLSLAAASLEARSSWLSPSSTSTTAAAAASRTTAAAAAAAVASCAFCGKDTRCSETHTAKACPYMLPFNE